MTAITELEIKLSESRDKMRDAASKQEPTEEDISEMGELQKRHGGLEAKFRLLKAAEPELKIENGGLHFLSKEDRERAELVNRCNLGNIFESVVEHRSSKGPERELQEELGMADNQIPLSLLRGEPEKRTAGVTPAPTNVETNQSEIIEAVFPMACSGFLGVHMPTVGVGEATYPVLSTSAAPGVPAEGADQDHSAAAFTSELLTGKRIQASMFFSIEDRARFRGLEESLRKNLSDALADKLDSEILVGSNGLFTGSNIPDHDVTALTSYSLYRSQLAYSRVDGKYAGDTMDLKVLLGSESYAHSANAFRSDNAGDRSGLEDIKMATGGVKVSSHVPVAAGAKKRQEAIVRLGTRKDMVCPLWDGITLTDPYSLSKSGEILITASLLHAIKIVRPAGFFKQMLQHIA